MKLIKQSGHALVLRHEALVTEHARKLDVLKAEAEDRHEVVTGRIAHLESEESAIWALLERL